MIWTIKPLKNPSGRSLIIIMTIVYDVFRCAINFVDGIGFLALYYFFGGYGLAY